MQAIEIEIAGDQKNNTPSGVSEFLINQIALLAEGSVRRRVRSLTILIKAKIAATVDAHHIIDPAGDFRADQNF